MTRETRDWSLLVQSKDDKVFGLLDLNNLRWLYRKDKANWVVKQIGTNSPMVDGEMPDLQVRPLIARLSAAFGLNDIYGLTLHTPPGTGIRLWQFPGSAEDVSNLFARYVRGDLPAI